MIKPVITVTIAGVAILHAVLFWFVPRLTRHDLFSLSLWLPDFGTIRKASPFSATTGPNSCSSARWRSRRSLPVSHG
jgi:uncharacterized membrane protein